MQYELRTKVIEQRRRTFSNLVARYGDRPASRYQEGTIDLQPVENFHYRPLWAPDREIYDERYSALRLTDPYAFTDPRQLYYAPYVASRAGMQEAFATSLEYLRSRDLLARMPAGWQAVVAEVLLPLRHYEAGAQLISVEGARFAWGTTIDQCVTYAAFDRIGNAQMLSRTGLVVGGGSDDVLVSAKREWLQAPALQGLRRLEEELLVDDDWATELITLHLSDLLVYGLMFQYLDEEALLGGAGAYSLVAQHLAAWFADQRRWVDALLRAWLTDPGHAEGNRAALQSTVDGRWAQVVEAASDLACGVAARIPVRALDAVTTQAATVAGDLAALGLRTPEVTR